MISVGIRELKAHLSAYVRKARAGKTVVITDRGKVVAELCAPRTAEHAESPAERKYREAVASGALIPPTNPGNRSWLRHLGAGLPPGTAEELLDAERGET